MITSLLAAASVGGLLNALIYLVIVGLILWVVWWAIGAIGIPDPIGKVIRVLFILIAAIIVINILLGLVGHGFIDL